MIMKHKKNKKTKNNPVSQTKPDIFNIYDIFFFGYKDIITEIEHGG